MTAWRASQQFSTKCIENILYRGGISRQQHSSNQTAIPLGATRERPLRRRVHTREILLTSAEQLFIERGYAQVSVSDICGAAGFTRGAFYSNFTDKDDITSALFDQHAKNRLDQLRALLKEPPTHSADEWAQKLLTVTTQDRGWILLFLEFRLLAARQPELAAKIDHHDKVVTAALTELVRQQHWAREFPAAELAKFLLAAREGVLVRTICGDESATDMINAVTAVASKAVAALGIDS
ncbi:MAG: TetR/AcrR family transcriptional regulator [Mycobacterium sp.]|uniref:TetR/AcrR family transcriptional regulator n=1 Tax=Mycobacterium sp. TaxID=1785 RepID=UPI0038997FB4